MDNLIQLYGTLIGWVLLGFALGRYLLPKKTSLYIGKFLFWFGVPLLIVASLRGRDLSGGVLVAPVTAWIAILVGAAFAWIWIDLGVTDERLKSFSSGIKFVDRSGGELAVEDGTAVRASSWSNSTQGSFLLAMMVGNTGYMGYPVILSVVGKEYFAYAVFYDLLGSTLGAYGLGVALAAYYGTSANAQDQKKWWVNIFDRLLRNPALWSLVLGLSISNVKLPEIVEQVIKTISIPIVPLSLVMIGLQLSQLPSIRKWGQAVTCLIIKMLLVPLVVGTGLMFFGVTGAPRLAMVLQMAMPPAFATLVIAQAYNLDKDLAVTSLAFGSVGLLFTLPVWIWLFS
ncbi:AEC family transporter [Tumidithrix elongata RA019]|uniref:AEC family transporter n=1 Tax=Tumidithrix elongata BACA0141 TaxID=2716417 RepID=A0AAW9Q034_9CYAN|nr:AEC family transporter [Tumidithrix elongata RA019]